ncbi:MAG: sulfatase/phosphatase domain-containing protein [Phycisphaeraceae bacterium]
MALRRNLLIVLAHGLRSDAVGESGAWPLCTPNLEKLIGRGLRLVATSACPADRGGMVSLLSGLHARQHGYVAESDTRVCCDGWPALLRSAGYFVAGVGCVDLIEPWLNDAVVVESPDTLESSSCAYLAAIRTKGIYDAVVQQRRQRMRYGPFEPDRLLLEPDDDIDGFIGRQAQQMLDKLPADRPWALIVIFSGPGNDLPPPSLYDGVVSVESVEHGFAPADLASLDSLVELDYPRVLLQRLERHSIGRIRADYLGRVSLIDYEIGQMVSHVEGRSDSDRTWFVLAADRGHLLGEHGIVGHRSFLAGSIDVPAVIAPPTPAKAQTADWLVSTVDVAATIARLGGCDAPKTMAGRSLLPVLAGEPLADGKHTGCLSEFGRRLMLETERYKIVFDTETHRALGMYDLLNDSDEKKNLIETMVGRNLVDAMRWRVGDALLPLRSVPA